MGRGKEEVSEGRGVFGFFENTGAGCRGGGLTEQEMWWGEGGQNRGWVGVCREGGS